MYSVVLIYHSGFDISVLENLNWNDIDCEVLMTAVDTKEEIVKVIKTQPDMIFICTEEENINIFKLAEKLMQDMPGMVLSFVCGIRKFEFIKRAMDIGAVRYILTPLNENELKKAVDVMKEHLTEKKHIRVKESVNRGGENPESEGINSFVVRNALAYIEENYTKKISLSDVADEIYVSRWHLSKLLNKYTGKSFADIINGYRIDAAKNMLKDSSLRISDIAETVGFSDSAHFSHVFKRMTGISANEYRNKIIKSGK